MGKRTHNIHKQSLGRILLYILGRRPDEFGLLPDREGFVPVKDLLKALHEEGEWRHIVRSHLQELLLGEGRDSFVVEGERIQAKERHWHLDLQSPVSPVPKILYAPIRRKAHRVVVEKGLKASLQGFVVLTPHKEMAERMGRRKGQDPVVVEVLAERARAAGTPFFVFGELFLTPEVLPDFLAGPKPPPEDKVRTREAGKGGARPVVPGDPFPGTFVLDPHRDPDPLRRARGKKRKGWKEEVRGLRRKNRKPEE